MSFSLQFLQHNLIAKLSKGKKAVIYFTCSSFAFYLQLQQWQLQKILLIPSYVLVYVCNCCEGASSCPLTRVVFGGCANEVWLAYVSHVPLPLSRTFVVVTVTLFPIFFRFFFYKNYIIRVMKSFIFATFYLLCPQFFSLCSARCIPTALLFFLQLSFAAVLFPFRHFFNFFLFSFFLYLCFCSTCNIFAAVGGMNRFIWI